jgi:hypothetical protein
VNATREISGTPVRLRRSVALVRQPAPSIWRSKGPGSSASSSAPHAMVARDMLPDVEIRIEVAGEVPPAKGEAKSMLSETHPQRRRVAALLAAAEPVMSGHDVLSGDIRLDVTVTAPTTARLPDATNMLGGIGDVLQARATGAVVDHLGPLGAVACFLDDSQIQEIHFRRRKGAELGYVVLIRPLADRSR